MRSRKPCANFRCGQFFLLKLLPNYPCKARICYVLYKFATSSHFQTEEDALELIIYGHRSIKLNQAIRFLSTQNRFASSTPFGHDIKINIQTVTLFAPQIRAF